MTPTPEHYFGARYYSSALGRFMTPDWSEAPEAVPYADLANPQSLNLYSYVLNNPVTSVDPLGHSHLIFDGNQHTITLVAHDGHVVGTWSAYNNVAVQDKGRVTSGPMPDGTFKIEDTHGAWAGHLGDKASGQYGPGGDIRLEDYVGVLGNTVTGAALHAGRLARGGTEALTLACLRTCGPAMATINKVAKTDPLTTVRVTGNDKNIEDWLLKAGELSQGHPTKGKCVKEIGCGS